MRKQRFYLHFEIKPPFADLDVLFDRCMEFQPVLSTSYALVVDESAFFGGDFYEFVKKCFPRYDFVLCPVCGSISHHEESRWVMTDMVSLS